MAKQLLSSTLSNGWTKQMATSIPSATTKMRPFPVSQLGSPILPSGVRMKPPSGVNVSAASCSTLRKMPSPRRPETISDQTVSRSTTIFSRS